MLTKLKNMLLSSVDLVRRGANQEADICLFKSADAPEEQVMDSEMALVYTGALAKSILSIQEDDTLDNEAKVDMIRKSFEQFGKAVEKWDGESTQPSMAEDPVVEKSAPDIDVIQEIETKKA